MKLLILGILTFMALMLMKVSRALGFSNIDVETAVFDVSLARPAYRDPGTRQWGQKLASNTAYNWRHSDLGMYIPSVLYSIGTELTYDTGRDYRNKIVYLALIEQVANFSLPWSFVPALDWAVEGFAVLSTTYAPLSNTIHIKAENTGGFTIQKMQGADRYYGGIIQEIRQVVGA